MPDLVDLDDLRNGCGEVAEEGYRVLSIQSHVVHGYVGNRSAVFPLQVLGFDVDFINTVQLSNHLGYSVAKGHALDEQSLEDLYNGLRENELDKRYTHLLTGFVRSKPLMLEVAEIAKTLKQANANLLYVCDPVMGDLGKMYVHGDVLEVYKEVVLPLADIVTPNQFEAELLTGITIRDSASASLAMKAIHEKGPPVVIISSCDLGDPSNLVGFASSVIGGSLSQFMANIPRFPASFSGSGDLFAALFLAWHAKSNGDIQYSCEATLSTIHAVLRRTLDFSRKMSKDGIVNPRDMELRLIQSKSDIENPVLCMQCRRL